MLLITTALKETFPKQNNERVLFLGEWCKIYNQKNTWQQFNSKTVSYHWDDREKLYQDTIYLNTVYEKYLEVLTTKLNLIHKVNYSKRYWRILIGVWLKHFIEILYDRYLSIQSLRDHDVAFSYCLNLDHHLLVPFDMRDFRTKFVSDKWNHYIYATLLGELTNIKCHFIKDNTNKITKPKDRNFIKKSIAIILSKVNRSAKFYFDSSFINRKHLAKLQLLLGEMPSLDVSNYIDFKVQVDDELRALLTFDKTNDDFEIVLNKFITLQMPTVYLEGYKTLEKRALKHYPKKSKVIVTGVSFAANDGFKIWAAKQCEQGSKYCIHQHGGHYGMGLFASGEQYQLQTADKNYTWGWDIKGNNAVEAVPAGKLLNQIGYNPKGDILMPLMTLPRYSFYLLAIPLGGQILNYWNDQLKVLSLAPNQIKDLLKLRIRVKSPDYNWNAQQRLTDAGFKNQIDSPKNLNKVFAKRLSECRLCIATYNATTYLETFASNYPTLLFWDAKYWELRPEAQPYFDELHRIGILHYDAQSLVDKVKEVYQDPMQWWQQEDIQMVKNKFCQQFANVGEQAVQKWHYNLQKIAQ